MREKSFYLIYGKNINILKNIKNKGLTLKERWLFCKQLKLFISSGMKVTEALDIMEDFFIKESSKNSIREIRKKVYLGQNISEAMEYYKEIYPNFLINMIKIGEDNGNLTEVLGKLEFYYEKQWKINNKVKESMVYPIFLMFFSIIVGVFLINFILPQFQNIISDFNVDVPIFTKIIFKIFRFFSENKFIILTFIAMAMLVFKFKTKKNFIKIKYEVLHRTPYLKSIYYKLQLYKVLMCLWMILQCGLNIDKALEEACLIVEDKEIVKNLKRINLKISQGSSIGEAFKENLDKLMSKDIITLIRTGEESGNLETILKDICYITREEILIKINSLVKFIEPVIILLMSIHIGILIMALFFPILGIMDGITNV